MIVVHEDNSSIFNEILSNTVERLQSDSTKRPDYYLKRSALDFEKDVLSCMNESSKGTIFEGRIELVSGHKFPDIVAYVNSHNGYGVEVKTTQSNKWKSTGSSIFEGTRVENIQNIYLLFGKLSTPVDFKFKKYEECLYDVAITHSPRYLIDMDIGENETIFSKVGVEYNELRNLDNPFDPIKKYFREGLKKGEDLWWVDNNESTHDLQVRTWNNINQDKKEEIIIQTLAYFPILLGNNSNKYKGISTWLVTRFGIVNHALRDMFSAGGQVKIRGEFFPRVFGHLTSNFSSISKTIDRMSDDDANHYWGVSINEKDKFNVWKSLCLKECKSTLNKDQFNIIKDNYLL